MLNPWQWPEHYLLVNIRHRNGTNSLLVNVGVTQVEVFEHYFDLFESDTSNRNMVPYEVQVTPLDRAAYEMLGEIIEDRYKIGD